MEDFYAILEIERTASDKEIKIAYRKKIRLYHPDVNKNADAEEKAKQLNKAYETLSNPEKKREYDFQLQVSVPNARKGYANPNRYYDINDLYKEAQRQQEAAERMAQQMRNQNINFTWTTTGNTQTSFTKVRIFTGNGFIDIEFK